MQLSEVTGGEDAWAPIQWNHPASARREVLPFGPSRHIGASATESRELAPAKGLIRGAAAEGIREADGHGHDHDPVPWALARRHPGGRAPPHPTISAEAEACLLRPSSTTFAAGGPKSGEQDYRQRTR
jgi:hypothetical protein